MDDRSHIASLREDNATLRNRVTDLIRERDDYKIWWIRDSKGLGAALNDLSLERACKQDLQAQVKRLRGALECLLPGLVLDLRYADLDDDKDAMRSRIETVEEALGHSATVAQENKSGM